MKQRKSEKGNDVMQTSIESQKNWGLEEIFKGHFQPHCNKQEHLQLGEVPQSSVQPVLERSQGWGLYHPSGQPVTVVNHSHCKILLPYI